MQYYRSSFAIFDFFDNFVETWKISTVFNQDEAAKQ